MYTFLSGTKFNPKIVLLFLSQFFGVWKLSMFLTSETGQLLISTWHLPSVYSSIFLLNDPNQQKKQEFDLLVSSLAVQILHCVCSTMNACVLLVVGAIYILTW